MKTKLLLTLLPATLVMQQNLAQVLAKNQSDIGGTGYDYLMKLCASKDGGILLAGYSNSNQSQFKKEESRGDYNYWVVKALRNDADGSIKMQWEKTIGGNSTDNLVAASPTKDGGFILGGNSLSGKSGEKTGDQIGGYDYWLVKTGNNGNIEWDKTIGESTNDYLADLDPTTAGGYILAGTLGLTKIDSHGNVLWQKPGYYNYQSSVEQTKDGGYILTENNNSHYIMKKTDRMGNVQWSKDYGWPGYISKSGAIQTNDCGFIFYERGAASYSNSGGYYYDYFIYITKTDSLGNGQWVYNPYPAPDLSETADCSLQQINDQGFIFSTSSSAMYPNYYILKLDSDGNFQWSKTISGSRSDVCTDFLEVYPDRYIIAGYSNSDISGDKTKANLGGYDYWIVGLKDTLNSNIAVKDIAISAQMVRPTNKTFAYPNPAKNILHIQNTGKATFTLTNQSGKILLTKTINGNGAINVSALPAGLYYLRNNETGAAQKIMIAK